MTEATVKPAKQVQDFVLLRINKATLTTRLTICIHSYADPPKSG